MNLRTIYISTLRILIQVILFFVGTLKIRGAHNLPSKGPFIVVTNHLSLIDPALVLLILPYPKVRVFAARKWSKHPIISPLVGLTGAIWVSRGEVDRTALRDAIDALEDGQVLGMAPEGTRSRVRMLQQARQGASFIATRSRVPLIPVGIVNSDEFTGNLKRLRRSHFEINIGDAIDMPDLGPRPKGKQLLALTELIMAHIANVLPEKYHGHYASSSAVAALKEGQDPWPAACRSVEGLVCPEEH